MAYRQKSEFGRQNTEFEIGNAAYAAEGRRESRGKWGNGEK
jgi:hypothetical protein